ncbi:MAG: TetR/AcrR family transcriptional regulator [Candidatus Cloacimonetes bacterium]|nr:TetR/AcrR family transcriptional regulator [Candidatus Cloacimonadota bacterium]MBT4332107.1 TetR/AcrR family transcriptional regulator [Candidatus Cloacimonadota bacterium]MBT4575953.1 TetR/AcrR family transcriptional regulator [Candidatus Cloacimonadota bacterium]MBT5420396.1 TetR/AcrR family transcriptional regulator [Candidatus Cloacimonadota bacterium]
MFSERQEQIIETAIKIIAEKGIQNLTTKNLAKEIGISEPALYRHFDNKLEILKAVIVYFQSKMKPAIGQLNNSTDTLSKIESFILEHLKIISNNPNFAKVIFSEANFQNEDELISKMNNLMNQSHKILESVVQLGQSNNEIRNDIGSLSIVRMIIGSLRLIVIQWSMSGMIFNLETEGKQFCEDIKRLISAA